MSPIVFPPRPLRVLTYRVVPVAGRIREQEGSGLMQPYLRVLHPSVVLSPPHGGLCRSSLGGFF